jgi:hypothetical protein
MDVPAKNRAWMQWLLAGIGLLLGLAAAWLTFHVRTPVPTAPPRSTAAPTALYVQHEGRALRLHWDPRVSANSGVIRIHDAGHDTRLELNAQELRSGVATYWPESNQVTFQLELDGGPVAAITTPAEAPVAEARPSPFPQPRPKRAVTKPVKLVPRETVEPDDDPAPKRSRWGRVAGKIPLLRRLRKH